MTSERLAQVQNVIAQENWSDRKTQKPFRIEYEVRNGKFVTRYLPTTAHPLEG